MDGFQGRGHRGAGEVAGHSGAEAGLYALLAQDLVATPWLDPGQDEARGIRPQIEQRYQLRHGESVAEAGIGKTDWTFSGGTVP
jgi:hypothetical protein